MGRVLDQYRNQPGRFQPTMAQIRRWQYTARLSLQAHATDLLRKIEADQVRRSRRAADHEGKLDWLLPYRAEIRRAIDGREADSILVYLTDCPRDMVPICVWLLGQCADRFRLNELARFCNDRSPKVRKHVANALRRHEAWHWLDQMAKLSPDDYFVQRIAAQAVTPINSKPFSERLKKFGRNVDASHAAEAAAASRMPYWASGTSWEPSPPKSVALICRLLRRIQRWVHGRAT